MHLTVVGNPANRRVRLFAEAVRSAGWPAPAELAWRDVLRGAEPPGPGSVVRIDSPGEDDEVDTLMRGVGPVRHGELVGLAESFRGLLRGVDAVAAGGATLLSDPADIAVLCDKRRCHAVLAAAGMPVPAGISGVTTYAELRSAMASNKWTRVFVKPAHGSSAAGVVALAVNGPRLVATTSAERQGDTLFNSLRVRRYEREDEVAAIVDRLPGPLHVERWYPKASLAGRTIDLRVVVIAGRATHVVVRGARGPLTNLHLGNARGDVAAVRGAAGTEWAAAIQTCERVAACFPRTLQVGVDLMFRAGWREHAVAEVNAFGDLLPGVLHEGRDTYAEQVCALATGRWKVPACAP